MTDDANKQAQQVEIALGGLPEPVRSIVLGVASKSPDVISSNSSDWCFYCSHTFYQGEEQHEDDCIYVAAVNYVKDYRLTA